jgi:hypothetical protein
MVIDVPEVSASIIVFPPPMQDDVCGDAAIETRIALAFFAAGAKRAANLSAAVEDWPAAKDVFIFGASPVPPRLAIPVSDMLAFDMERKVFTAAVADFAPWVGVLIVVFPGVLLLLLPPPPLPQEAKNTASPRTSTVAAKTALILLCMEPSLCLLI